MCPWRDAGRGIERGMESLKQAQVGAHRGALSQDPDTRT